MNNVIPAGSEGQEPGGDPTKCSRRVRSIVRVIQSSGSFRVDPKGITGKLSARILEHVADVAIESNIITVTLCFGFKAIPTEEGAEKAVVESEASYTVTYRISEGDPVDEHDLQAFANINGRLNLTPYWREYLHNCLSRAGLPPFMLPPFNAAAALVELRRSRESQAQSSATED